MADTGNTGRGRSVVVAVSGFGDLRPAFRQAARLAASLNADLAALLVEDESLRRMAALPFVQQVSLATARSLPMAASDLDREFRAFAHLAERMIAEVAREAGIAGRIQTARGQLAASVRTAVRPGDLVMICTTSSFGAGGGRRHLAESILAQLSDCDLLLQSPRPEATRSIAVCDDGTEAGKRAIDTAAALARAYGSELTVIDVDHQARELPSHISLRRRSDRDLEMVRSVLRQETPAMLILPAGLADRIDSELLVETTGCAVLIVR
jgi:nucleotide-binding universal stress UspA family protein